MARQQRILITGANGTLGKDLLHRAADWAETEFIRATRNDFDFSWPAEQLIKVLDTLKPDAIINTAAYTAVDAAESDQELARQVNGTAPGILAQWVSQNDAYLMHVSTDYVFDGEKDTPYQPDDSTQPINYYGQSKLNGEQAVLTEAPHHAAVVRTSWLFGSGAKNFVPFVIRSAQAQTPIKVVNDQWGTPTWTGSLSQMLLTLWETGKPSGMFHGCNIGKTSRYEQALEICRQMDVPSDFITPVPTETFGFPAKRPRDTAMETSFPETESWQDATRAYLASELLLPAHA